MKIYLMRQRINIEDLLNYVESNHIGGVIKEEEIVPVVNRQKRYINSDGIEKIKEDEVKRLRQEKQIKDHTSASTKDTTSDWDYFKQAMKSVFQ